MEQKRRGEYFTHILHITAQLYRKEHCIYYVVKKYNLLQ